MNADASRQGIILLPLEDVTLTLRYDAKIFRASIETIEIKDSRMSKSWGSELRRVTLTSRKINKSGFHDLILDAVD